MHRPSAPSGQAQPAAGLLPLPNPVETPGMIRPSAPSGQAQPAAGLLPLPNPVETPGMIRPSAPSGQAQPAADNDAASLGKGKPSTSKGLLPTPLFPPSTLANQGCRSKNVTAPKRKGDSPANSNWKRQSLTSSGVQTCRICKSTDHFQRDCPDRPKCNFCRQFGHKFDACPEHAAWKLRSVNLSEEESLALLEISDNSGLILEIDINKHNFYDVVHDVYKKHDVGAFIVRPLKANYIADLTTLSNKKVIPYTEVLTKKSAGVYTLFQQVETFTKKKKEGHTTYNAFRKQAADTDFKRTPGYDLGGRSSFWPSMVPLLTKIANDQDYPRYVNNKGFSFFPKKNESEWCLSSLSKSYAKYLLEPEKPLGLPGVDTVELFIGEACSMTGWHVEDLNLGSVNFHVSGKPKMWVEVSYKHLKKVKALAEKKYPEQHKVCPNAYLHKNMVLLPQELLLANIPFRTLKQQAGDYVITLPEGLHFVVNSGHSIAEATNYACEDWVEHRKRFPVCICQQSKNIEDIAARFNF